MPELTCMNCAHRSTEVWDSIAIVYCYARDRNMHNWDRLPWCELWKSTDGTAPPYGLHDIKIRQESE